MASPDKISLIIQSGAYDRVHYALVMASAALAVGKPVTLFFTMGGTRALTKDWADQARESAFTADGLATFEDLLNACQELSETVNNAAPDSKPIVSQIPPATHSS